MVTTSNARIDFQGLLVGVALACASGCHVPGVVLALDADATVTKKLDSYCVSLVASGQRRFGQRYSMSADALPQTIGVKSDGEKAMVARLDGYAGGLRVASTAQSIALPSKAPSLELDACVSNGPPVSALSFHARDAILTGSGTNVIADKLAFVHTGLETPGASSVVLGGAQIGILATYASGKLQQTPTPMPSGQVDALVAIDYDEDCADDLVVSTSGGTEAAWDDGTDGTFGVDPSRLPAMLGAANDIASADVNGDGFADLVGVGTGSSTSPGSFVLLSDGKRGFTSQQGFDTPPTGGQAAALGDVDGDGKIDLVVGLAQSSARWWKGDGAGDFMLTGPLQAIPAPSAVSIALTDLDGDGDLDVVAAVTDGMPGLRVSLNDGHGTFTDGTATWVPTTLDPSGVALSVVDVDGDCADEILFAGSATAARLLGVHNGVLQDRGPIGSEPSKGLGAADLDGDGLPEIVLLEFSTTAIFSIMTTAAN